MSMEASADIQAIVKEYVISEVLSGDEGVLDVSTELIEQGILDSMSLLRLIAFLEERFSIQVADEDIVPRHFHNLRAIEELIASYQARSRS